MLLMLRIPLPIRILVLLLILIAVAAAVLVYVWVTGFATSITSAPPAGKVDLKIEAAYYTDDSTPKIVLYVRNIGDVDALIDYVYVWDNSMKTLMASTSKLNDGDPKDVVTVTPGELKSIEASLETTLSSGNYVVKVVTVDGYEFIARITV